MTAGPSLVVEALSPEEVREQVEGCSSVLRLQADAGKGRYLVARRRIAVGEVVLSERPLFQGSHEAVQSRRAFVPSFAALADQVEDVSGLDEDCLHPCSSLCDCVAGIVLAKQAAMASSARPGAVARSGKVAVEEDQGFRTLLRLRKFASLCRSATSALPQDCASSLLEVLRPELRELTSEEELEDVLLALSCNRFGSYDGVLDLMFAGSMFEHSCEPNCFVASAWREPLLTGAREYRALSTIEEGEALCIDYMMLPHSYLGMPRRQDQLAGWGFSCSCARCTKSPELTRAFVCQACGMHELCPVRPTPFNTVTEMICRACNKAADVEYAARCLAAESAALRAFSAVMSEAEEGHKELLGSEHLLGRFHFANFQLAFKIWADGPDFEAECTAEELEDYTAATDRVIECITRWCGSNLHPQLLPVYHYRALLAHGDLSGQRCFLDLERAVLARYYPEESAQQDAEVMHMVHRKGPTSEAKVGSSAIWERDAADDEASEDQPQLSDPAGMHGNWNLSGMD